MKYNVMTAAFKRNLVIGFGVSLLLLIISSVASYTSIRKLTESAGLVDHTNEVIQKLEEALSVLKDAETGQRGFLLTGDERFLKPYHGAYDSALNTVKYVKRLTIDNPAQQNDVRLLEEVIVLRLRKLEDHIENKKSTGEINMAGLDQGRQYMDRARAIVNTMKERELALLASRTATMNQYTIYTPWLIVVAALLSLTITVVSFLRVNKDFETRIQLQKNLEEKDADITRRIDIIRSVSNKIAAGEYGTRVPDQGADGLGDLSGSLNKMGESLQQSFRLLSDKEWLQSGIAGLNERMLGQYDMTSLAHYVLEFILDYTETEAGAIYLTDNHDTLKLAGGLGLNGGQVKEQVRFGEGITGKCAVTGKIVELKDVPEEMIIVSHAAGSIKTPNILALPVFYEKKVVGVIELASIGAYTPIDFSFLESVGHSIGTVINSIQNRRRLQELLEETQSQAEELQVQHTELENMNSELEAQAEKLQASEEELKVQQEELLEANQELEERSRLLEEKNQVVFERNLEIQKKADELEQSTKYKSEFLANMSHELRTPLNSILLLSRLMAENNEKNLNNEQLEYARVILSSGQGLLSLIDEILDLSRIEAGKMDLAYADLSIQELIRSMHSLFDPMAKEKGVEFRVQVDNNVPGIIETDRSRLEQILRNLVSNALKFTSKGYVLMNVFVPVNKTAVIGITVKDTGIGISKDKQQIIFEAFQQADGSTRRKYGGTGLGLSISRQLARLLGGEIELESEPGKGSAFTLYIPVTKLAAALTQQQDVADIPVTRPASVNQPGANGEPEPVQRYITDIIPPGVPDDRDAIAVGDKVILIVEDDTNFAKSLLQYTRQRNYKGIVSVRGDEAVELAVKYKPAGILLDIQLPVKDGWEVMEELKNNSHTRHIPVHIMSSYDAKYKSLLKGAVDFINKPVAFEQMQEIFAKIEYVLNYNPRKVLIVEENTQHARALAYYLETFRVNAEIQQNVHDSVQALLNKEVSCVILDMGIPDQKAYDTLEEVKKSPGLENVPIIIFTGKSLSRAEEKRIKQYADTIIIKTAQSYQRILDEVSLFLHLVEERGDNNDGGRLPKKLGALRDVLKGKTVLVADDDVRNIYSLTKSLEAFNMTVLSATDGQEALNQLEANSGVDIVLMDMMMPEMDGYESIRRIRRNPAYRNLPVIAVTAKAMTGDREKCISAGASDYITKPVDIDQLLSLLRVWLYA
jgi:signal transduction histidine kinase/DNA-binding response OmpR family regulator/CHASE3 domain sensor protein